MLGGGKSVRDSLILRCFGNPHAQRRNPANYSCIVRIADVTCLATRLVRGDKDQVIVVQLTPAADIRISKLEEKTGRSWSPCQPREGIFFRRGSICTNDSGRSIPKARRFYTSMKPTKPSQVGHVTP